MGGERRRAKSLRIGVHLANAVVWGPVCRTHLVVVFEIAVSPRQDVYVHVRDRLPRARAVLDRVRQRRRAVVLLQRGPHLLRERPHVHELVLGEALEPLDDPSRHDEDVPRHDRLEVDDAVRKRRLREHLRSRDVQRAEAVVIVHDRPRAAHLTYRGGRDVPARRGRERARRGSREEGAASAPRRREDAAIRRRRRRVEGDARGRERAGAGESRGGGGGAH
eukprot:31251-Pelagococcus_subviridis.AAC.2